MSWNLAGCGPKISDRSVVPVSSTRLERWAETEADRTVIIDVRRAEAFGEGHIPGAIHMELPELSTERTRSMLRKAGRIVVYGEDAGSTRAVAAFKRLASDGHKNVYLLDGGYAGWRMATGGSG